ncbi:hypothetical protein PIB30_074113 [Stylosanthes scabra]|uniref:Uncharacterized protein n=1 Tax=Stylosanthes scabra TaxID=79078 RepID=A0ABU6ZNE6_9FABA|nr:hypothetical protein [Stylosanthes scabra]
MTCLILDLAYRFLELVNLRSCDIQEIFPDGSLDVGIDDVDVGEVAVDGDGETYNASGSEGVDHVRRLDSCHTFEEVMAMEFESPEAVLQ